jgi:serine/threonine-protein kinase
LKAPIAAPSSINPALTPELDRVVLKALARDASQRFQTAHEFAEALRKAAEEGSRRDVAEWTTRLAADGLELRLELLQALEASAIHTQVPVQLPVVTGSSPQAALAPPQAPPAPPQDATQPYTQATTSTEVMPQPQPLPPRQRAPWVFAAVGTLTAVSMWLFSGGFTTAPAIATHSNEAPSAAPHLAVAVTAPAPAAVKEPESDLPVVSADSMPLSAAPADERKPAVKKPAPAPLATATRPVTGHASSCNPPYRIDASGVRRVKPECL